MEKIKIIEIKNIIANGGIPPRRIRYDLLEDDYNTLIYDEEELEYRFENDYEQFWEVSNHHLNDYVEILQDKIEKLEIINNGNVNAYALLDNWGTKCALTKHSKIMVDKINEIIEVINER